MYLLVVGIEMNASAVADANRNVEINDINNCSFLGILQKAEEMMRSLLKEYLIKEPGGIIGNTNHKMLKIVKYVGKAANLYAIWYQLKGSAHDMSKHKSNTWLWDRVCGRAYGVSTHIQVVELKKKHSCRQLSMNSRLPFVYMKCIVNMSVKKKRCLS